MFLFRKKYELKNDRVSSVMLLDLLTINAAKVFNHFIPGTNYHLYMQFYMYMYVYLLFIKMYCSNKCAHQLIVDDIFAYKIQKTKKFYRE